MPFRMFLAEWLLQKAAIHERNEEVIEYMDDVPEQTLIILVVFLVLCSAFFSASETAYSTCNKIRLKQMHNRGNAKAGKVLALAENYDQLISGILVGNNFVNIFATTIATMLFTSLLGSTQGPSVSTVVMTVTILIFGEITPKTLARYRPDAFAMFAYPLLKATIVLLTPIVFLFNVWQKLVGSFFKDDDNQGMSGEELITMIEEVEKEGNLEKEESELIQSAIEFSEVDIADIYTPRVDMIAFDLDDSREELAQLFQNYPYSRIPLYRKSVDNIVGFIHYRDFFELGDDQPIESVIQIPAYLPLTTSISDALKEFQSRKVHLGVVFDEFGGTAGIITLEDIIEELVGEIWDEHDEVKEEILPMGDDIYKIDGTVNIDDVFELYDLYEDDIYDSNTLSGFIIEISEHVPAVNEVIYLKNLEFKILQADGKTIRWVLVSKADISEEEENAAVLQAEAEIQPTDEK